MATFIITLPFRVAERITLFVTKNPVATFAAGCAVGWYAHQRYGDKLLLGLTGDVSTLWLELDSDKDGHVSFSEFEIGMKKRCGSLCPPTGALKAIYDKIIQATKALDKDGDGNISPDELKAALKGLSSLF